MGDPVTAYNPSTGQAEAGPIRHVWLNHDLVDVRVHSQTTSQASAGEATQTASGTASRVAGAVKAAAAVASLALTLVTGHTVSVPTSALASSSAATAQAETIHTTANHPWLTADRGWVQAGDLRSGEPVVTLNGAAGTVVWVHTVAGQADMYNLTVANDHTYAVGDGQAVVHNIAPDCVGGEVVFKAKARWSQDQLDAAQAYVDRANKLIDEGFTFTRHSVSEDLRARASDAADTFRQTMINFGFDMHGYDAGHVPDTIWTGVAEPPDWLPLPQSVNRSLGSQSRAYPKGYIVTRFVLKP